MGVDKTKEKTSNLELIVLYNASETPTKNLLEELKRMDSSTN